MSSVRFLYPTNVLVMSPITNASSQVDDMITYGPVFVANINEDFDLVQKIVERDYTNVLKNPDDETYGDHPIKKPGVLWSAFFPERIFFICRQREEGLAIGLQRRIRLSARLFSSLMQLRSGGTRRKLPQPLPLHLAT